MICFIHTYPKGRIQWRIYSRNSILDQLKWTTSGLRYCGNKQFGRDPDGTITIDVCDNTRRVRGTTIDATRRSTDPLSPGEMTTPKSITGSLPWVARQGRPDLGYRVSRLQSSMKGATVGTLVDANRCVELAHRGFTKVRLRYPMNHLRWDEIALLTVTDASFSNEIIAVHNRVDSTLSSTSTRRRTHGTPSIGFCQRLLFVGCADLRCRRKPTHYNMVSKLVTGVIAELKGQMRSRQQWRMIRGCALMCIPHLAFTDLSKSCRPPCGRNSGSRAGQPAWHRIDGHQRRCMAWRSENLEFYEEWWGLSWMDFCGYDDIRLPHDYETGLHIESLERERLPSTEAKTQTLD